MSGLQANYDNDILKWRKGMKERKEYILDYRRFGDNLDAEMNRLSINSRELAEKMETTSQVVYTWRNGERLPQLWMVGIIADIFGVTIDKLMEGVVTRIPNAERKNDNIL